VTLLLLAALACDSSRLLLASGETTRDLVEARARWNAQRITDYTFTLQRLCFCGETRPMRVTVRNGEVQSVVPVGELLPLPGPVAEWYPSITGLFDIVADAIAMPAGSIEARYDAVYGFPLEIAIDYWINVADDETRWIVSNVVAQ